MTTSFASLSGSLPSLQPQQRPVQRNTGSRSAKPRRRPSRVASASRLRCAFRSASAYLVEDVLTDSLAVRVSANGYDSYSGSLHASNGALQFIELEPVCRIAVEFRQPDGSFESKTADRNALMKIGLLVDQERYRPTGMQSGSTGIFLEFAEVVSEAGHWQFVAPEGYEVLNQPSGPLAPGQAITLRLGAL